MQNSREIWKLLKENTELNVVADFFMSPTAEIADYVLPAATWLERDELCNRRYINYIAARQKVIEPLGESWHDMKIVIELAKRIPWANRKYIPWGGVDEFIESHFIDKRLNFKTLKEMSCLVEPMQYKKYQKEGFDTPTAKVELFSTAFEKYGQAPLPFCKEPPESPTSTPEDIDEYPLILYTGGRHIEYFHSEGRQIPKLRNRVPDPLLELNPETAKNMNIADGDWVWLETTQIRNERVRLKAKLTNRVHPKMAHARHGWWFPEKPAPEHGCFDSNVNVILSLNPPRGKECASVRTRGTLCKVYKTDA
jgi:anaerobic selenocysteine-containing dehydrogenase